MNQSVLLQLVERLEGLVGRLPATIQKPILRELTPTKELFLQQRFPRFLFTGSNKAPLSEIVGLLFPEVALSQPPGISTIHRWDDVKVADRGKVSILDARTLADSPGDELRDELRQKPADVIFFFEDQDGPKGRRKNSIDNLINCLDLNDRGRPGSKVLVLLSAATKSSSTRNSHKPGASFAELKAQLQAATKSDRGERLAGMFQFPCQSESETTALMSVVASALPNEARIEMARLSNDRQVQAEIAHTLVKSTTAVCTAIGAQPIPLADLPILTTLQLVMVSGIMYVSGRERSLRAATEFVGALGANVGAGMLLREGTRAILKFFPGWGNLICGMVAGAGTYAIGRAATVFFIHRVSIKEARRTYRLSRKKSTQPRLQDEKQLLEARCGDK